MAFWNRFPFHYWQSYCLCNFLKIIYQPCIFYLKLFSWLSTFLLTSLSAYIFHSSLVTLKVLLVDISDVKSWFSSSSWQVLLVLVWFSFRGHHHRFGGHDKTGCFSKIKQPCIVCWLASPQESRVWTATTWPVALMAGAYMDPSLAPTHFLVLVPLQRRQPLTPTLAPAAPSIRLSLQSCKEYYLIQWRQAHAHCMAVVDLRF